MISQQANKKTHKINSKKEIFGLNAFVGAWGTTAHKAIVFPNKKFLFKTNSPNL